MQVGHRGRAFVAVAMIPAVVGLAGCTSNDDKKADESTTSTTKPAVDPKKVSPTDLPQPPAIENAAGARQEAEMGECKTAAGSQEVTGKITNAGDGAIDYVVVVNWVNGSSDVMGRGVAVLKAVEPGAAVDWSVSAEVAEGAEACTLNVQKGTVTE
ncbi:hypothetical protein EK0264_09575 [Epidermidibacterium keratini]|uniref:Uncharacterized protein n=1 Tax=Epidermidibacterium keratini TaxID=1891644 RepID=A0A7L4YMY2_9ACTN|nr:FxLYD domain-containing protein [Epidermidibacterium keratini]QHC00506.1 hypothetical protein EK0264_09575 [Epidermidibacterium keratini]